jgi:hypothetical protein
MEHEMSTENDKPRYVLRIDTGAPKYLLRIDGGAPGTPGLYAHIPHVPKRFHRWMMWLFFGWRVTRDVENKGTEVFDFGRINK